ncbi:hypothetical protein VM98_35170, partial [Streptomyces rubellomurinus subsp. indigoferus]
MLADHPTGALDPPTGDAVFAVLRPPRHATPAAVMLTHDAPDASRASPALHTPERPVAPARERGVNVPPAEGRMRGRNSPGRRAGWMTGRAWTSGSRRRWTRGTPEGCRTGRGPVGAVKD